MWVRGGSALRARRIGGDWQARFGHGLLLRETFVDPQRCHGGVYRAANWIELGLTRGNRRTHAGYSDTPGTPKRVFIRPLRQDARAPDPSRPSPPATHRRPQDHAQCRSNALAAPVFHEHRRPAPRPRPASPPARQRFGCRGENGRYLVPSEFVIRDCLVRIDAGALDQALAHTGSAPGRPRTAHWRWRARR